MKISIDGNSSCDLESAISDYVKKSELSREVVIRNLKDYIVTKIDDIIHVDSSGDKSDLGPLSYYWDIID